MNVEEIMTEDPACCTPEMSLHQAAQWMVQFDCGALPVVDTQETRKPIGIITDRDITCRIVAQGRNPLELNVSDAMTTPAVTVAMGTSIDECRQLMQEGRIRRMLVADVHGRVCGIVAQADLAKSTEPQHAAEMVREVSSSMEGPSSVH